MRSLNLSAVNGLHHALKGPQHLRERKQKDRASDEPERADFHAEVIDILFYTLDSAVASVPVEARACVCVLDLLLGLTCGDLDIVWKIVE